MLNNYLDNFIAVATHYGDKSAIHFHETTLTYDELHQESNRLAQCIVSLSPEPETIIPLIMEREPSMVVAMIAILKAGCAFLPISPMTPCARIKFILNDTKANIVISNRNTNPEFDSGITIIKPSEIINTTANSVVTIIKPTQLAYVMYTSGSTGNPKGVMIEHAAMLNLFNGLITKLNLTAEEKVLALTDYTFDISLIELLMPLLLGATIVLTEQSTVADGVKIKHYLERNNITLMQATPLTWEILVRQGWQNDGKMTILVGGEKFKTELAELLNYKQENIWNMYGPTETSMWSMGYQLGPTLMYDSVSLGEPLSNTIIELFDKKLNGVKFGEQGEIYIAGAGLARGYLNNEKLTAKKFIIHPKTQIRFYKTGDFAIAYDEKNLCYLGRTDDQLKFGGIRIEAGEIETVIEEEPFVKKAVVKAHEAEGYYKSLAAYIEIDEEKLFSGVQITGADLSNFVKNIYDETYRYAKEHEHGRINNCGWQSAFTGQLFSAEELDESYQFVRQEIMQSCLSDVLEVGCGTGDLLLEYIDKAEKCTVIEISSTAIDYLKTRIQLHQQQKITFRNESVLNIHNSQKFSCVIMNSVIQYLPSINALVTTLSQLIKATKQQGTIIIGDVRSLELLDVYLLNKLRLNRASSQTAFLELSALYYKSRDAEIVLSPNFFYALQNEIPEISYVDIAVKHGCYNNELNYFRYDVVLHINKEVVYEQPSVLTYVKTITPERIKEILQLSPDKVLMIHQIPNSYMLQLYELLERDFPNYLPSINENSLIYQSTQELFELTVSTHNTYVVYDAINSITELSLHFYPKNTHRIVRPPNKSYKDYRTYCREPFNPWLQKICFDHIRLKVGQHVVAWVNPSAYVWVEKWPITINGKLDKKQLALPTTNKTISQTQNTLEKLQEMWCNITGDNALVDQEFWVHGVSSLCMYFFLATINENFRLNINYHEFRDYNTLDKLARYIEKLLEI